ncbi:MAG TPA: hypothetical protein VL856_17260 [Acidimicrobiia bacterium]|nr:hypothetical protein [Acidimicrobiia bacterium]
MTVLMVVVVIIAALLCVGMGRLGRATADRSRADTAADAAALAAAEVLAGGDNVTAAKAAAHRITAANGGELDRFRATNQWTEVEVHVGDAHSRARAEIDW